MSEGFKMENYEEDSAQDNTNPDSLDLSNLSSGDNQGILLLRRLQQLKVR